MQELYAGVARQYIGPGCDEDMRTDWFCNAKRRTAAGLYPALGRSEQWERRPVEEGQALRRVRPGQQTPLEVDIAVLHSGRVQITVAAGIIHMDIYMYDRTAGDSRETVDSERRSFRRESIVTCIMSCSLSSYSTGSVGGSRL